MTEAEWRQEFARRVRVGRRALGLTQYQLAEKLQLGRGTVANIESGRRGVQGSTAARMATVLGFQPPGWDMADTTATEWYRVQMAELARLRAMEQRVRSALQADE